MMIVLTLWTIFMGVMGWAFFCNNRTYKQRGELLDAMRLLFGSNEYWSYSDMYSTVSYDNHFYCLLLLGDWKALYDKKLIELWSRKNA